MRKAPKRGAVLILTLFLILVTSFALSRFVERAYSEILAEAVFIERDRLRVEAYSALEVTLGVLFDVIRIDGALHGPGQGWQDPLRYAGYEVPSGMEIEIEFEDEMGKIPLPGADLNQLRRLFDYLGIEPRAAEDLADSLLSWVNQAHQESSFIGAQLDYEQAELPYRPPHRPLRSLYELAAIRGFREWFFDAHAVPNERFYQLASLVSLYQFQQINVNSASPAVLHIYSEMGEHELGSLADYAGYGEDNGGFGLGASAGRPPYFEELQEASAYLQIPFNSQQHGVRTAALRVNITVHDGAGSFRLSAVVAPPGGNAGQLRPVSGGESQRGRTRRPTSRANRSGGQVVPYPFQFLEVRENESIL